MVTPCRSAVRDSERLWFRICFSFQVACFDSEADSWSSVAPSRWDTENPASPCWAGALTKMAKAWNKCTCTTWTRTSGRARRSSRSPCPWPSCAEQGGQHGGGERGLRRPRTNRPVAWNRLTRLTAAQSWRVRFCFGLFGKFLSSWTAAASSLHIQTTESKHGAFYRGNIGSWGHADIALTSTKDGRHLPQLKVTPNCPDTSAEQLIRKMRPETIVAHLPTWRGRSLWATRTRPPGGIQMSWLHFCGRLMSAILKTSPVFMVVTHWCCCYAQNVDVVFVHVCGLMSKKTTEEEKEINQTLLKLQSDRKLFKSRNNKTFHTYRKHSWKCFKAKKLQTPKWFHVQTGTGNECKLYRNVICLVIMKTGIWKTILGLGFFSLQEFMICFPNVTN